MAGLFHHRLKPAAETLLAQRLADSRRDFLGKLALSMAVFLLVALIFLAMYTSIRRSVAALGRSSQRFAAGDYSARVQIASQDEMAGLGRRFNQMADEIQTLIQDQHDSRLRLEGLLQNNPSVVFALDPATLRCRFVSPNVERLTGRAAATLAGRSLCWLDSVEPEDAEGLQAAMMNWQAGGFDGTLQHAYRLVCGTQQRWVEVQLGAVRTADDRVVEVVGSCTDITERQKAHTRLELAASVFSSAREGIIITDASGSILQVNDAFTQITGWSREEILGRNPRVLQSGHQGRAFYEAMWEALRQGGYWEGEIWNRRKTGEVYVQTLAIVAVRGRDAQVSHFVALFSDITLQKQHEQQLRQLAHFDPLTGLANRSLLADRLEQALVRSRRSGLQVAVVMIDLDGFKAVNDTHGHEAGDQLLKTLAARMQTCLREQDTLARLGGDEFVAVLCELEDAAAVQLPLQRLLAVIALPVALAEVTVQVSGSVGVSLYPQQAEVAAEVLMRQADQAMYVAKQEGKNRYRMFEPGRLLN